MSVNVDPSTADTSTSAALNVAGDNDDDDILDVSNDEARFQVECEFVQALSSPQYLQHLHQQQYFEDPGERQFVRAQHSWRVRAVLDARFLSRVLVNARVSFLSLLFAPIIVIRK